LTVDLQHSTDALSSLTHDAHPDSIRADVTWIKTTPIIADIKSYVF
jgi:hypothetical protein